MNDKRACVVGRGGWMGRGVLRAALAGAALLGGAAARAEVLYLGTGAGTANGGTGADGGWWFDSANWENSSGNITPFAPPTGAGLQLPVNINSDTKGTMPALGVVFDPAHDPHNSGSLTAVKLGPLYVSGPSSSHETGPQPNALTVLSGTLEVGGGAVVGRDALGKLVVNGGAFVGDGTLALGVLKANGNQSGEIEYHGGLLQAGINSSGTFTKGSSQGLRLGLGTNNLNGGALAATPKGLPQSIGTITIFNDGPAGAINTQNLVLGYGGYGLGVLDFHYGSAGGKAAGNVRTIQISGDTGTFGQLALRNYAEAPTPGPLAADGKSGGIGAELILTLDQAPTVGADGAPQDLALITYGHGVHASGKNPANFFSPTGQSYAQGSQVTATFGDKQYAWEIYYDGSVTFTDAKKVGEDTFSPDTSVDKILKTGGDLESAGAVVLIGVPAGGATAKPAP